MSKVAVVYAAFDMNVVWSQGLSVIALGDVWDRRAPLVEERPELFSDTPTLVRGAPDIDPDQGGGAGVAPASAEADKPAPRKRGA